MILIAAFCAASSCINEDYSLDNFDDSMTLLPGLSISENYTYNVPVMDAVKELTAEGDLLCDENGNYWISAKTLTGERKGEFTMTSEDFAAATKFKIGESRFVLQLPENMFSPIHLNLTNPTNEELILSLALMSGTDVVLLDGISVMPGECDVVLDQENAMNLVRKANGQPLGVTRFYLAKKSAGTKAGGNSGNLKFTISVSAPIVLTPENSLSYEYNCSLVSDLDIPEKYRDRSENLKGVIIHIEATSKVPADIAFSISGIGDYKIAAGSPESPAVTGMDWKLDDPFGQDNYHISIVATLPEGVTEPANLNKQQDLSIKVTSITFENGI